MANSEIIGAGQDTARRAPKDIRVLVACEESQTVCIEFRKIGFDAYSCDIQPCSGGHPEWHIQGDVAPVLAQHWDLIVAHPPCTFLSNAGACRLYPTKGVLNQDRYEKGLKAKEFFMLFYNHQCKHVAIENPVSSTVFNMPVHSQEIQPYHFGHPYTKKTRLWLNGLPPLIYTNVIDPTGPYLPAGTSRKDKSKYGAKGCAHEAKPRSVTFPGIAKAMAEQWGAHVLCEESPAQNTMEICHTAPNSASTQNAQLALELDL